ncbi:hypothetical protein ASG89_03750 [Paenibacillus sp. Soil766]|uniref:PKD domain-containing protein n=1 Tax=Paenibacillus sp. Soil766 TaxID=1736404 RepID=UPI00070F2D18|nr:PKD domain-containing protein [Paenibacillus sp. Soil766]KRF03878.1 hypothetical protein ASG89_03750 [Paenibacillus sp. Soil766]
MKHFISRVMFLLLIFDLMFPLLNLNEAQAASNKTLHYNFELGIYSESTNINAQYSASDKKSFDKDISSFVSGTITSVTLKSNGVDRSSKVSFDGSIIKVAALEGTKMIVHGKSETKPMHQIYRQPPGKIWEHKGEKNPYPVEFTGASGTPSEYPGLIPIFGKKRYAGPDFDYRVPSNFGPDLRYSCNSPLYLEDGEPGHEASGDFVYDCDRDGYAVTTAYEVDRPNFWFNDPTDANVLGTDATIKDGDKLVQSSIEMYDAEKFNSSYGAEPFSVGKGNIAGQGMIRTMMLLGERKSNGGNVPNGQIIDETDNGPYGLLRNYQMYAIGLWKGDTYKYQMSIEVTYTPPVQADLTYISIDAGSCVQTGASTLITIKFQNIGIAIPNGTTFNVTLSADGVVFKTYTYSSGLGSTPITETVNYTFTSSKSITLAVDSNNAISEASESNNLTTKNVSPVASCGHTGGNLTGTVSMDKAYIPWKSDNLAIVKVNDSDPSCKASKFNVSFEDSRGNSYKSPDMSFNGIVDGKLEGTTMFFYIGPNYLGGIGSGNISVSADVLDTCGSWSSIGNTNFTIGNPPPVQPPNIQFAWFKNDYSTQITKAIVGDNVALKITKAEDIQNYSFSYEWDFTVDTPWIAGIPARKSLVSPIRFNQLNGILADEVGEHTVCIKAANSQRSATYCESLQVIPPNPIPIITGGPTVKENRILTPALDVSSSYSPVEGRTVDHTKDEKTGLWATSYSTPGEYDLSLHVYDNTGLKSLQPATHHLTVTPDYPPIVTLEKPIATVRNTDYTMRNTSYSPDGDNVVIFRVRQGYDAANNGVCTGYADVSNDANNFIFTPTKVGTYCFQTYAEEDYGKNAASVFTVEVVDDAPDASFTVKGKNTTPVIPDVTVLKPLDLAKSASSTLDQASVPNMYRLNSVGNLLALPASRCTFATVGFTAECGTNDFYKYSYQTIEEVSPTYSVVSSIAIPPNPSYVSNIPILKDLLLQVGQTNFDDGEDEDTTNSRTWALVTPTSTVFTGFTVYSENMDSGGSGSWYGTDTRNHFIYVNPSTGNYTIESYTTYSDGGGTDWSSNYESYNSSHVKTSTYSCSKRVPCLTFSMDGHSLSRGVIGNNDGSVAVYPIVLDRIDPSLRVAKPLIYDATTAVATMTGWMNTYKFNTGLKFQDYATKMLTTGESRYSSTVPDQSTTTIASFGNTHVYDNPNSIKSTYGLQPNIQIVKDNTISSISCPAPIASLDTNNRVSDYTKRTFLDAHNPNIVYYIVNYNKYSLTYDYSEDEYQWKATPNWFTQALKLTHDGNGNVNCVDTAGQVPIDAVAVASLSDRGKDAATNASLYAGTRIYPGGLIYNGTSIISVNLVRGSGTGANKEVVMGNGITRNIGQLQNNKLIKNVALSTSFRFYNNGSYENVPAGVSFRMQDNRNMYRVEVDANTVSLLKIVNGVKTYLETKTITAVGTSWVNLKVRALGNQIKVYVQGVPYIILNDNTFLSEGYVGPYTEVAYTEFKSIIAEKYPDSASEDSLGVVLVDEPAEYDTIVTDAENDPIAPPLTEWTVQQTDSTMFFDAGDGKSGFEAMYTSTAAKPIFSKVGKYRVGYKVVDDPQPDFLYPSNVFGSYRKASPIYYSDITVHRKPIARLALYLNGDGSIGNTDTSYDPDRCYANLSCQSSYDANKGIYERMSYFVSPSGVSSASLPTRPIESGDYYAYLAVKDEYGAWSDFVEATINITVPLPNNAPTATLTFPTGTQGSPSYVSLIPTIYWNQKDPDAGSFFTQFEVSVKDQWGNCVECKVETFNTSLTSWSWTLDTTLTPGGLYQVQVRVWDEGGKASAWSNTWWMVTNRPPTATMLDPNGTQASPSILHTLTPVIRWTQIDPDPSTTFHYFHIQITNEANTVMILDTGPYWQGTTSTTGSWQVNANLPAGQKLRVRVRTFDGVVWSDYSEQTWMYINRAPIADFDWSPKPVWEGDEVRITNTSIDPDGDELSYLWTVEGPEGITWTFSSFNFIQKFAEPGSYKVTLTVTDGILTTSVDKMILALPLTINAEVTYMDNWLILHNQKGHQTQVNPKQFYSGEIFVVKSRSASAPVVEVIAWIDTIGLDGQSLYVSQELLPQLGDNNMYSAELFDSKFQSFTEGLPTGAQTIHFQITYENGTVKNEDIPIEIIGNVQQSIGVHRVQ